MELIKTYNEENLFKTKFTNSGWAILILLVLALIGLGERVLYDLARTFASPIGDWGYLDNSKVIVVHAVFVVGLLILNIVINYIFGRKREQYAIALIPYFLTSIALAIQLAIQLGVYFTSHHNNLQFYLVMILLVVVTSYAIFHIQNNYRKTKDTSGSNNTGLLGIFVAVFALFAVLILSFGSNEQIKNNGYQNQINSFYPNENNFASGQQNLTGEYVIYLSYLGTDYDHILYLNEDVLGNLSGNGGHPFSDQNLYQWSITSGTVFGSRIDFFANYTYPSDALNPQTVMHVIGTISPDKRMYGTWSDNYRGENRTGSFTASPI